MPTHCHYYIGDMQQVCDCEPRCVPACCDDAEERLEATIAAQSARIAELEAENARFERELGDALFVGKELQAERDAVRKALAWHVADQMNRQITSYDVAWRDDSVDDGRWHRHPHDGTPEGVEAALLAAAREGGGV